jgi:hypothetical protein
MIARASRLCGDRPFKAERADIQFFDKRLDHADWVIFTDVIVQGSRKV